MIVQLIKHRPLFRVYQLITNRHIHTLSTHVGPPSIKELHGVLLLFICLWSIKFVGKKCSLLQLDLCVTKMVIVGGIEILTKNDELCQNEQPRTLRQSPKTFFCVSYADISVT